MQTRRAFPALAAAVAPTLLAGCVVVLPRTVAYDDPACQLTARRMTLEPVEYGALQRCRGQECVALLATAGVVAAGSVIVSGSIAVVGNVVYWVERQAQCRPPGPPGPA